MLLTLDYTIRIALCQMRRNLKLETPAVFCATWMRATLTESWDDRTCSVIVTWTRRNACRISRCDPVNWQLKIVEAIRGTKHARLITLWSRKKYINNRNLKDYALYVMLLPVHMLPFPVNPSLHSQVYEWIASIHSAFLSQWLEIHSSMSKTFNIVKFRNKTLSYKSPD